MIQIKLYYSDQAIRRFRVEGHAGYAKIGSDIICSAISVLVFNTINAMSAFTEQQVVIEEMNEAKGLIACKLIPNQKGKFDEKADLLLKTMELGLTTIQHTYGEKYVNIKFIRR